MNIIESLKCLLDRNCELSRQLGALQMRSAIHEWALRHVHTLSAEAIDDLHETVEQATKARSDQPEGAA